jgi:hypothetical protein
MLRQSRAIRETTFDATVGNIRRMLDDAERQARLLASKGVLPQLRGFADAFDPVRSALSSLEATRGPTLRRGWANL